MLSHARWGLRSEQAAITNTNSSAPQPAGTWLGTTGYVTAIVETHVAMVAKALANDR